MFTYAWKPATGQWTPRPRDDKQAVLLQTLGDTYKWMLYGDDDTLFFVDTVLDLLQPFDPELPYAISDNIWFEANSALVSGLLFSTSLSVLHMAMRKACI